MSGTALTIAYGVWAVIAAGIFMVVPPRHAIWVVLIGGWIALPPGNYPAIGHPAVFPFWVIGGGLPSDTWLAKSWSAPLVALVGSLLVAPTSWRALRLRWYDLTLMAFCLWPLAQSLIVQGTNPTAISATAFLVGVWAIPWLIGRVFLRSFADTCVLVEALTLLTLALLPVAIVEGMSPFRIHTILFGEHPFAWVGAQRYVGFRPQALFSDGNQYGLWCACAALAATWRWLLARERGKRQVAWGLAAAMVVAMVLAAQSVGAIGLMLVGLCLLLWPIGFRLLRRVFPIAVLGAIALAGLHLSGIVPLRSLADDTVIGRELQGGLRSIGRGSFGWRIAQDLKTLPALRVTMVLGSGRWNWFADIGSRPWGLPLLIVGQFGLVGLVLLMMALTGAAWRHLRAASAGDQAARLTAVILIAFVVDALMNSFLFYPALLMAGALPPSNAPRVPTS